MAVDPKYIDLINADIDGEISDDDRATLHEMLDGNAEAKSLYEELAGLCNELDGIEPLSPPPHLRHTIAAALPRRRYRRSGEPGASFIGNIFGSTTVRHAAAFAAGVVLTYAFVSSNQISQRAFDDITGLVGTISDIPPGSSPALVDTIRLTGTEIAGTVNLHRTGALLVIDFDLMAQGPVRIVAGFDDPDVWFNGFAQLEGDGTRVSAETGRVTLTMEGQRRYAVYLHNASHSAATVNLRFYSSGELVHEQDLNFGEATN